MTLNQRAEKARKDLFTRYDQLNALWLKAEERLTQHHVPRPVQHIYAHRDRDYLEESEAEAVSLGLQKVNGKWRLCYGEHFCLNQPDAHWRPITECSAEIRVSAVEYLPDLEKAIVESAEKFIPRVDAAIQHLARALRQPDNIAELIAERAKLNGQAQ